LQPYPHTSVGTGLLIMPPPTHDSEVEQNDSGVPGFLQLGLSLFKKTSPLWQTRNSFCSPQSALELQIMASVVVVDVVVVVVVVVVLVVDVVALVVVVASVVDVVTSPFVVVVRSSLSQMPLPSASRQQPEPYLRYGELHTTGFSPPIRDVMRPIISSNMLEKNLVMKPKNPPSSEDSAAETKDARRHTATNKSTICFFIPNYDSVSLDKSGIYQVFRRSCLQRP
jgi:hypothetical protein